VHKGLSAKEKPLDFEITSEPWNRYELSDQARLKTRYILKNIYRSIKDGKSNYRGEGQAMSVIVVPEKLRKTPETKKYSPKDLLANIDKEDMKYRTVEEEWNEYLLDDGARIRMKVTVTKVSRTKLRDKNGDPIYSVDNNIMIQVREPK